MGGDLPPDPGRIEKRYAGGTRSRHLSSGSIGTLIVIVVWPLLAWSGISLLHWGGIGHGPGGCGDPNTLCFPPEFVNAVNVTLIALGVAVGIASAISPLVAAPESFASESRKLRWFVAGSLACGWLLVFLAIAVSGRR